ncbi:MAG: hypothetical protein KDA52_01510 [Planctomycetaceae bacterium]|nr:hypothetical protein [Planctomycetaceae bacterium]
MLSKLHHNQRGMESLQTVALLAMGAIVTMGMRSIWDDGSGGGCQGEKVGLFEQLTGETSARTSGWETVQERSSGSLAAWGRRRESQQTDPVMDTWIEEATDGGGVRPGLAIVRAKPRELGDVPVNQPDREVVEESPKPKPRIDPPANDDSDILVRTDPWFQPEGADTQNLLDKGLPRDRWLLPVSPFAGQLRSLSRFAQISSE